MITDSLPSKTALNGHALVLFDGVCNLCNAGVNFIIDRDPAGYYKFAALQSEAAHPYLDPAGRTAAAPETMLLVEDGHLYRRSDAALRIARHLSGLWPACYVFIVLPRPLRDALYDVIARNRYRWFGQREACRLPTPELRARFL